MGQKSDVGRGCELCPHEITSQFIEIALDESNSVYGILSGHLHQSWDGMITTRIHGHVFDPAVDGIIGIVHIHG